MGGGGEMKGWSLRKLQRGRERWPEEGDLRCEPQARKTEEEGKENRDEEKSGV